MEIDYKTTSRFLRPDIHTHRKTLVDKMLLVETAAIDFACKSMVLSKHDLRCI